MIISELLPVTVVGDADSKSEDLSADKSRILREIVSRVDESVSNECREKLSQLLAENANAFSVNENDLGRTNVLKHRIDTGNA